MFAVGAANKILYVKVDVDVLLRESQTTGSSGRPLCVLQILHPVVGAIKRFCLV